jgi:hypothetical protein
MKQGRHDGAKLGYAVVEVYGEGHLHHSIRTHGRTLEAGDALPETPVALPPVHGLRPNGQGIGLYLRQPWCDSADIPTPWGLDAFSRKRIRNDYPLMALWEMGVRNLRVPLDDLAEPETRARMAELAALGHRFTAYSYGLPKGAALEALKKHGEILTAWEVIAPITSATGLLAGIAALKGATAVYFNACRVDVEAFSSSHGLEADERGAVEALLALDGARDAIDGVVFGIAWQEAPAPAIEAARRSVEGLGVKAAVHVQFAHRKPLGEIETERHDANRIAESAVAAMTHGDVAVFLDNFTGIDRGYYFSGGLVDRLYNPCAGAHIVRHLHAALGGGCEIAAVSGDSKVRVVELRVAEGQGEGQGQGQAEGVLLLPAADLDPASLPQVPSRETGRWIDLASGEAAPARLTGPTLVLADGGRSARRGDDLFRLVRNI